jgi:vesicle-fusing ATPase
LMTNKPPLGRPLLILATTSERTVMQQLQVGFMAQIAVPNVRTQQELAHVMEESGAFPNSQDIERVINELHQVTGRQEIGVGIRQILTIIQTACQDERDRAGRFAELMADAMADSQ